MAHLSIELFFSFHWIVVTLSSFPKCLLCKTFNPYSHDWCWDHCWNKIKDCIKNALCWFDRLYLSGFFSRCYLKSIPLYPTYYFNPYCGPNLDPRKHSLKLILTKSGCSHSDSWYIFCIFYCKISISLPMPILTPIWNTYMYFRRFSKSLPLLWPQIWTNLTYI